MARIPMSVAAMKYQMKKYMPKEVMMDDEADEKYQPIDTPGQASIGIDTDGVPYVIISQ